MKSSVLLSLGCTLLLWACATASIAPSESQPSVQPTPQIKPTPTPQPSFGPANPNNPCPDFHLTPQNLELPVQKITNVPLGLNAMCSSPSTGDLYLLTDTEIFLFDINTQQTQKVFENAPAFAELVNCAVDNQENFYLADQGKNQLFQYSNINKTWTKLERNIDNPPSFDVANFGISRNNDLEIGPHQELFVNGTGTYGSRIYYYDQNLKPQLFKLNYHIEIERFDTIFHRKQFAERSLNTVENTLMPGPLSIAFGPQHLFMSSGSGWFEMFSIELSSGSISPLPSIEQRGKDNFENIEETVGNISLSNALFLTYSQRYKVLFQALLFGNTPAWTSPETGCWQELSTQIKPAGLAEGGDGHLYLIDTKTQGLNRIQLSPEIFQSPTAQPSASD